MMTEHYNQEADYVPNAGWNGFATISDFYSSFGAVKATTGVANWASIGAINNPDTAIDQRLGGRFYKGCTDISGQRPGFQIGQQYDKNNVALKDRKGAALAFNPTIASDMKENGSNLEYQNMFQILLMELNITQVLLVTGCNYYAILMLF